MFAVMSGIMLFSGVFAITGMKDMCLYEMPLFVSLLGFGMGTILDNFHMLGVMLLLRAVVNILARNASPIGQYVF